MITNDEKKVEITAKYAETVNVIQDDWIVNSVRVTGITPHKKATFEAGFLLLQIYTCYYLRSFYYHCYMYK